MTAWAEADDTDLLMLVRDGHQDAMAELWSRHYPATLTAARRVSRQPQDAEEFASDAFSGMLHAISHDGGPSVSVRGYLLTAVRNQAANRARRASANDVLADEMTEFEDPERAAEDPVAHHAELGLVRQAFATLPPRWQMVLWRTAVDHEKNTDIAADLDRSPNAVAALAKRARAGFRIAYLRAHESSHGVAAECAPYAPRLVELLPGSDTVATAATREHVADCPTCARRLADLRIVDADLGGVLLPALLTLGPGIAWAGSAHATHAAGAAAWLKWGHGSSGRTRTLTLAGATAGVLVAGSCAAFALTHTAPSTKHEALAPATSQAAQASDSGTVVSSSPTAASTRSSSTTTSSSRDSATTASTTDSPSVADTSSVTNDGTTTDDSTSTTSSHERGPSSTRPSDSTTPAPRTSTADRTPTSTESPTSTRPPGHTSTRPPKPRPTRTAPLPSPTSTKPPICLPLLCWPWDAGS